MDLCRTNGGPRGIKLHNHVKLLKIHDFDAKPMKELGEGPLKDQRPAVSHLGEKLGFFSQMLYRKFHAADFAKI